MLNPLIPQLYIGPWDWDSIWESGHSKNNFQRKNASRLNLWSFLSCKDCVFQAVKQRLRDHWPSHYHTFYADHLCNKFQATDLSAFCMRRSQKTHDNGQLCESTDVPNIPLACDLKKTSDVWHFSLLFFHMYSIFEGCIMIIISIDSHNVLNRC